MTHDNIPARWIAMHPSRSLDPHFWLRVAALIRAMEIDPAIATDKQVQAASTMMESLVSLEERYHDRTV